MENIENIGEPMEMEIYPVVANEEIAVVADLAVKIWQQHYTPMIGEKQVAYMLETLQSEAAIAKGIRQLGDVYFVITWEKTPVGYLAIRENKDEKSIFLSKLYLLENTRGKGISSGVMKILHEFAKEKNFNKIWLTCNINNKETIAVYKHFGFEIVDARQGDIGAGYIMDDYIMEKIID